MHASWHLLILFAALLPLWGCATTALHNPKPMSKGEVMVTGGMDARGQVDTRVEVGLVHGVGLTATFGIGLDEVRMPPSVSDATGSSQPSHIGAGLGISYGKYFTLGGEQLSWKLYGEMEAASGFPHHWQGGAPENNPMVEVGRSRGRALISGPLFAGLFGGSGTAGPSPYTLYFGAESVIEGRTHTAYRPGGCQDVRQDEVCLERDVARKQTELWMQSLGLVTGGQYWLVPEVLAIQGEVTLKGTFLQIDGRRDDYSVLPTDVFTGSVGIVWTFSPF